jgi:NAD(P)H-nitrite reductase large subunit
MKINFGKNKLILLKDMSPVEPDSKAVVLNGNEKGYDKLVLATGSVPNKNGWPGQDLQGVTGFYHKQDLEALEKWAPTTKHAVISEWLIGIELAEMLRSRNIQVTLVREKHFGWSFAFGESQMINRHSRTPYRFKKTRNI